VQPIQADVEQRPYLGFIAASAGCLEEVLKQQPVEPFKTVTILNGTK
jgi:CTP synthase